jgi:lysozyme family protein
VFVGAGVVAVAVLLFRPRASSPGAERLARAIAKAEGFGVPGALPTRANNPGDLKLGGNTISGITVFETVADGWRALYAQIDKMTSGLSAFYSNGTTIRQMGQKWTATASQQLAWSKTVADALGVDIDTPIGDIV